MLMIATLVLICTQWVPALADDDSSHDEAKSGSGHVEESHVESHEEKTPKSGGANVPASSGSSSFQGGASVSNSRNKEHEEDERDDDEAEENGVLSQAGTKTKVKRADHDKALKAVETGKAAPLHDLKEHLDEFYPGRILNVKFTKTAGQYFYRVRILDSGNRIRNVTLNALTLIPQVN
jgi:uncharacterized membrane protein YkoI